MKKRQITAIITTLLLLLVATLSANLQEERHANGPSGVGITLSPERTKHILYGDHTGGGHKNGINKPCKSEFPAAWSDQKIIDTVNKIAANNNIQWKAQDNGYLVSDTKIENLKIRVVLNPQKPEIITAYPTNVPRNPCHAANDNTP